MAERPLIAWSHSALDRFQTCPKQFYHIRVIKDVKEEEGEHLRYGKYVHKALEDRVKAGKRLPMELTHLETIADAFAQYPGEKLTEQKLALDTDFTPCDWFDPCTYVRSVIDLAIVRGDRGIIVDWKTGKNVSDDFSQLKLAAAILMTYRPDVEALSLAFIYTRTKDVLRDVLHRDDIQEVWNELLPRVKRLEQAVKTTDFPAKPSGLCRRYCPVTSCPHHGG